VRLERFNDKAHVIVQEMLDYAEEKLVCDCICTPANADEYLALNYIKTCSEFIQNSAQYLEIEERIGADLFLAQLTKGRLRGRFERNAHICGLQLAANTAVYFPDYGKLLRLALLHVLQSASDWRSIRWNGVVLLAAASLPGVLTDIRRELRRRGMPYEVTLVADATLNKRIGPAATSLAFPRCINPLAC
jgi:hypothetical protein